MNWKTFSILLINITCIVFPYNIIGCAETENPYDDYATFFRNDLSTAREYRPFYYISDQKLYDLSDADAATDRACEEWVGYCHHAMTLQQAHRFICKSDTADIAGLLTFLQHQHHPTRHIPPAIRHNPMTDWFLHSRNIEALQYIHFAREAQTFKTPSSNDWGASVPKDSLAVDKLILAAQQGYSTATSSFIKARYAFQTVSLCFYNDHYKDCIWSFDQWLKDNPSAGSLYDRGLSYKAGSFLYLQQPAQAAYYYSQAFDRSPSKKISNYVSFSRCVNWLSQQDRSECLALCHNNRERADVLGLFLLGSNAPEATALKDLYHLSPGSPILEVLAIREINKIEQYYFSPGLKRQKGGLVLYIVEEDETTDHHADKWFREAKELAGVYHTVSLDSAVPHRALFATAAAYLSYITRQYPQASQYLDEAAALPATTRQKDQQAMTRLLITINQHPTIDSAFEAALLPSVQWLEKAAKAEGNGIKNPYSDDWVNSLWQQIYRNLMAEILARRYHQQGDIAKEALCTGNAERIVNTPPNKNSYYDVTKSYINNKLSTADILSLYRLLQSQQKSPWEQYLCHNFSVTRDEVTAALATTYIRNYRFDEALQWLKKVTTPSLLHLDRNPFGEELMDYQWDTLPADKGHFTRTQFIARMAALTDKDRQKKATAADLYRLAVGYYNLTFYGRAWENVSEYRSSTELAAIPDHPTPFQREYYGCYTAERYFKKAMTASADTNFQARCLFMMAKCAQKQAAGPDAFKYSKYFPRLVKEFGNTPFYKEAFNTCSYLRDFVRKQK